MYDSHKVITCCPAGRRRYLEVLLPYILRQKGLVDEHHWWLNTSVQSDIDYIYSVASSDPGFFKIVEHSGPGALGTNFGVSDFYASAVEPNTVYVKIDDDIVYIAPGTIEAMVQCRLAEREPLLIYPSIVNNVVCSFLYQQAGIIVSPGPPFTAAPLCAMGWSNGEVAAHIHVAFLKALAAGQAGKYKLPRTLLLGYARVSINCIAWLGQDMAPFVSEVARDDELVLSGDLPPRIQRHLLICPNALVSHYAYGPQRQVLDAKPQVLQAYKALSAFT